MELFLTKINISTNTFSYADTSIAVGTAKTVEPRKDFPAGAGVKYTLKTGTFPAGISLDENSGEISIVANTAVVQVARDYVIVATPNGGAGYTGTKEATAKIKISSAADDDISGYELQYEDLAVEQGSTGRVSPTGTIPAGANVGSKVICTYIFPCDCDRNAHFFAPGIPCRCRCRYYRVGGLCFRFCRCTYAYRSCPSIQCYSCW
jgi:hypothetical protein